MVQLDESTVARCPRCNPRSSSVARTRPAPLPAAEGPVAQAEAPASDQTKADADRIIVHAARSLPELSPNDTREAMDNAGIPTAIRGPRFAAHVAAGHLQRIGTVAATNAGNHGKHIALYRSLLYRGPSSEQGEP